MTEKRLLITLIVLVVVLGSLLGYKYWYKLKLDKMTPFDYVKQKGATKTTTPNAGDRYDYGDYGFYSNNRATQFSTAKKGSYTKVSIKWDDGTETSLSDIFK